MGGFNPAEIVFDVCVCVCVDLGKASVRWAALMCRNAEIPQWLCGSAVSLRQPPPSPKPQQDHGNELNRRHVESSLSLSPIHTHTYLFTCSIVLRAECAL